MSEIQPWMVAFVLCPQAMLLICILTARAIFKEEPKP